MPLAPLSMPLSHAVLAFTIELDNEFEHRLAEANVGRHRPASVVMWSNFLRFVGDGVAVAELSVAAPLPKPRLLSMLGGMERWRYVFVGPDAAAWRLESRREGWGSARGLRREWRIRPTPVGQKAQELWPQLLDEVEARWEDRFGADAIEGLRRSLELLVGQIEVELPAYLPVVGGANGMVAEIAERPRPRSGSGAERRLLTLLAQVLLEYTIDFERESHVSLPLSANVVRVLEEGPLDVRRLPVVAGVSKEATSMALRFLAKAGHVEASGQQVRLTPTGHDGAETARLVHAGLEQRWEKRFGAHVGALRAALHDALERRDGGRPRLSEGLQPYPDGWRASPPYVAQTNAVIDDPLGRLPAYPMVLHRGGWPDGS